MTAGQIVFSRGRVRELEVSKQVCK